MVKKDFISITDYTKDEITGLIMQGYNLKAQSRAGKKHEYLKGKALAMIFDKPSTRTRVSFDAAMFQLGGHSINIAAGECGLGTRETVADVARTISRFCDGIMIRTFGHDIVLEMAKYATVPVINGLTDQQHPCQAMADGLTIFEVKGKLKGVKLTYIGDGNNVLNSLVHLADKTGIDLTICTPEGYEPEKKVLKDVACDVSFTHDPFKAVKKAEFVYTDVWTSMGQEEESKERKKAFKDYQVNSKLLAKAPKDVLVMHCLPAHRGEEITNDVMESARAIVFDQAENRMHIQKSILLQVMK